MKQQLQFKIYLIEQVPYTIFNRAKLFNIGFDIATKDAKKLGIKWDCFTFHDLELVLENEALLYRCDLIGRPRYLEFGRDFEDSKDVLQVDEDTFRKANGFADHYRKW